MPGRREWLEYWVPVAGGERWCAAGEVAETERCGRYLSLLERQRIATLRGQGLTIRAIAQRLGQAPSTVSRELRRNVAPHGRGGYDGDLGWATPAELFHTALAQSTSSCCDDRSNPPWNPPVDTGSVFSRRRQPMTVRTCWQAHYFGDFLVRPAIFAVRPTVPARWLAL
jgi:hypothetical protein